MRPRRTSTGRNHDPVRSLGGILIVLLCLTPAAAQSFDDERFDSEYFEPTDEQARGSLNFAFKLLNEIPLPGPLPGRGPGREGDRLAIAVAGGTVITAWNGDPQFRPAELPDQELADGAAQYGISPDGRFRAVTLESGRVILQKKCKRCKKGWRKQWRVRVPGTEFARPLVTERRVYYGASDNRVYCVKRRNGHRVWAADLGGRVLRSLELLRVPTPPDPRFLTQAGITLDLVLVVPGGGTSIVALDARSGERVARFELPENDVLIGAPLALADGKVAVARQRYDARQAALLIFGLESVFPVDEEEAALAANESPAQETPAPD